MRARPSPSTKRAACVSALARGRWARALAFTSMQAQAQARLGSTVKWAVAIAAARNADLRAKAHSSESKAALEHAKRHARLAGEERELLGNRVEALSEQHDLLVEEHSSLRETADHQVCQRNAAPPVIPRSCRACPCRMLPLELAR